MKSNASRTTIIVALVAILLLARMYKEYAGGRIPSSSRPPISASAPVTTSDSSAIPSGDHQTIIAPNTPLIYTKHARCRMDCRHISEADIKEVLREGHVNEAKSKQEP